MLNKQGLLTLLLVSASSICSANSPESSEMMALYEDCGSPFYIGVGIGPETSYIRQKATIRRNSAFLDGRFDARDKTHHAGKGPFASLFAGYGTFFGAPNACCDDLYLAAELNADMAALKFRSYNYEIVHENFSDTTFKLGSNYGVSLLPGFLFGDSALLYGRVGFTRRKFSINTSDISLKNIRQNLHGMRYGLGMQHPFCDQFALRLEYSFSNFKSAQFFIIDGDVIKNTFIKPKANKVELGLIYNF